MSNKLEVMSSVANVIDFIKQQLKLSLHEAASQGKINVTTEELKKVCFYAENSVTTSFIKASDQIENSIDKWVKDI